MAKHNRGYSLIELLVVTTILGMMLGLGLFSASSFVHQQYAILTMRQLQQAITYARSLAISHCQKVTICPSYNRRSCGGSWQQGILVISSNSDLRFFSSYVMSDCLLSLTQNGYSNSSVEIHPNGMTNFNGHFNYKSLNPRYIAQFNLYFNKALRVYLTRGGYD